MLDLELRSKSGKAPTLSKGQDDLPEYSAFLDVSTDHGASIGIPGSVMPGPFRETARRRAPGDSGPLPGMKAPHSPGTRSPRGRFRLTCLRRSARSRARRGRRTTSRLPRTCLPRSRPIPMTCGTSIPLVLPAAKGSGPRPRRAAAISVPLGSRLGKYELIGKLAAGGWASSTRPARSDLNRIVALKMIKAGVLATDREIHLFQVRSRGGRRRWTTRTSSRSSRSASRMACSTTA